MVVDATHLAFGHAAPFAAGEFVGARAYAPIYLFKLIRRVSRYGSVCIGVSYRVILCIEGEERL